MSIQMACPTCEAGGAREFLALPRVPVQEGYLAPTADLARTVALGDIHLMHCPACGHVWNRAFDPDVLKFDPGYDISMFHSPAYRAYIDASIARLMSRYDLAGKVALEVACGKGDYLRALIRNGLGRAIGFDPTFIESSLSNEDRRQIEAHRAYYDPSHSHLKIDLLAARSVMQYFPRPRSFLTMLRSTLGDQTSTVVYAEVPNGAETFAQKLVWNLVYEHGCFFNRSSLSRVFRDCGFDVLHVGEALGGSQLEIEARPSRQAIGSGPTFESERAAVNDAIPKFADEIVAKRAFWTHRLAAWKAAGKRVALWGAGARAIGLMQLVPAAREIELVVDINPQRQNKHLPLTAQQIISPEALAAEKPSVVVATNANFAKEIETQVRALGLAAEMAALS